MALIHEESSDDKNLRPHTKPPESVGAGNDSDGYETATDTELNDVVSESDNHSHNISPTNDDAKEEHDHNSEFSENVLNQVILIIHVFQKCQNSKLCLVIEQTKILLTCCSY